MDDLDFRIIKKLLINARYSYRELADLLGVSVSAIHKRVQNLIDTKIIQAFRARPSPQSLKYLVVTIEGISEVNGVENVVSALKKEPNAEKMVVTDANFVDIWTILRDITELEVTTQSITQACKIMEPFVGILNLDYKTQPETLSKLDYKIIHSLNRDARKPFTDIALETGISASTVRKRLDRMIAQNLISFSLEWTPFYENDLTAGFFIHLKSSASKNSFQAKLTAEFPDNLFHSTGYSNHPDILCSRFWAKSIQDLWKIRDKIRAHNEIKDVSIRIGFQVYYFDCWLDSFTI